MTFVKIFMMCLHYTMELCFRKAIAFDNITQTGNNLSGLKDSEQKIY